MLRASGSVGTQWSVRAVGDLVLLLCAQVTRALAQDRTGTARGFVVGEIRRAKRTMVAALAAGCTRSTAGASEIWCALGSGLLLGDGR